MANIPDGYYYIRSMVGSSYPALDVADGSTSTGSNVQVYHLNHTDAQVWHVTTRRDGTRQILNRYSGKSIDVLDAKTSTVGQNVQLFNDNDTIAQQWSINEISGASVTVDGNTYGLYYVVINSTSFRMRATGASDGSNVNLASDSSSSSNVQWFFQPVEPFHSGGTYEIRTMLNKDMALDVKDGSATNGANIQLNYANHKNIQKFIFVDEGNGKYSICNAASGKYLNVASSFTSDYEAAMDEIESGPHTQEEIDRILSGVSANVQQWTGSTSSSQRWRLDSYGSVTYGGRKCGLFRIGSYVTSSGQQYRLDVANAVTSASANIQIAYDNDTDAQLFVLYPTDTEATVGSASATGGIRPSTPSTGNDTNSPTMPTPYSLGLAPSVGYGESFGEITAQNVLYPCWKCSAAWAVDGSNHYEYRVRARALIGSLSVWTTWPNWSDWTPAPVTISNGWVYLTNGIDGSIASGVKLREIEIQVRCAGGTNYKVYHGAYVDKIVRLYIEPTITFTSAIWTPEGLMLDWTSNYENGTTYLNIASISDSSGKLFDGLLTLEKDGYSQTAIIPPEALKRWPEDGDELTIEYRAGYDQRKDYEGYPFNRTATVEVETEGGTVSVEPTLIQDGLNLIALVPTLGTERLWVSTEGGSLVEAYKNNDYTAPAGYTAFDVPYAFMETNTIYVMAYSSDMTQWGADISTYTSTKRAYGWNWDGGHAYLQIFHDQQPTHNFTHTATYEVSSLGNRKNESVSYGSSVHTGFTAVGAINADTESTLKDFKALLESGHAIYRDLGGDIHYVAVTSYSVAEHPAYGLTDISVSMIEEAI